VNNQSRIMCIAHPLAYSKRAFRGSKIKIGTLPGKVDTDQNLDQRVQQP